MNIRTCFFTHKTLLKSPYNVSLWRCYYSNRSYSVTVNRQSNTWRDELDIQDVHLVPDSEIKFDSQANESQVCLEEQSGKYGNKIGETPIRRVSQRNKIQQWRSPSIYLNQALEDIGLEDILPQNYPSKVDLSYVSASWIQEKNTSRASYDKSRYFGDDLEPSPEPSLQLILANYMKSIGSSSAISNSQVDDGIHVAENFDDKTLEYLRNRGFDVEDVISWAWIIGTENGYQAALRLMVLSNRPLPQKRIPLFVFLYLLRRPRFSKPALQLLIHHAWDRLNNRIDARWESFYEQWEKAKNLEQFLPSNQFHRQKSDLTASANYTVLSEQPSILMIIRLLRLAGRCWPAALPNIAELFTKHIDYLSGRDSDTAASLPILVAQRYTFLFNKILGLLAHPTSIDPFMSITYQERAQFIVIRRMNEFEPPLMINREGYRASIKVQIAHRKTLKERTWASLKSKAWPPWKEDKLGLDASIEKETGISRASHAISGLKDAGYSGTQWENAAGILAGWDTDQSPTIQTRIIFPKYPNLRFVANEGSDNHMNQQLLWEARIYATRTIEEAWACFLAYRDEALPPSRNVYTAMMKKIVYERERAHSMPLDTTPGERGSTALAGDMPETLPSSTNPRDMIYLHTSPPDFDGFHRQMIADGVRVYGRLLTFLLTRAESLQEGFKCILHSDIPKRAKNMLLSSRSLEKSVLSDLPPYILTAYIRLLTRYPTSHLPKVSGAPSSRLAIIHAVHIMSLALPKVQPPWNYLLEALANPDVRPFLNRLMPMNPSGSADLDALETCLWTVKKMEQLGVPIDKNGFHTLCIKLEHTARIYSRVQRRGNLHDGIPKDEYYQARESNMVLPEACTRLKEIFKHMVSLDLTEILPSNIPDETLHQDSGFRASVLLPQFLEIPKTPTLHAFIRALGTAGDYDGIVDLLRWMSYASPELQVVVEEIANGPRMLRRCIVAARVFLEQSWRYSYKASAPEWSNSGSTREAKEIIESVEQWGGWATDEEVEEYLSKGSWDF
jgi:hypothetical protein